MSNVPIIGKLISPSAPQPVQAPNVVNPTDDAAAQDRINKAAAAQRKLGGSASNMLTGGAGDLSAPKTASNTLLGV